MKVLALLFVFLTFGIGIAHAQSTTFTYQGSLKDGGNPANGSYDFQVAVYDVPTGGSPINGDVVGFASVAVVNGVFTLPLGFPASHFPGAARYLEIRVKAAAAGSYSTLSPRESINSSPYSIKSLNAENANTANTATNAINANTANAAINATNAASLSGIPASGFILNTSGFQASSNFSISGNGTAGGTLSGNTVNTTTQYNLNGTRVLGVGDTSLYVGNGAGASVTSGSGNSFVGLGSGNSTTTGVGNTFVGYSTGGTNISGNNNTLIGNQPNVLGNNLSNATAIGAFASVGTSNSLVLGAIGGNNFCSPTTNCETVKVGIGTTSPAYRLDVGGRIRLRQETGSTGSNETAGIWFFQQTPNSDRAFIGMQDDSKVGLFGSNGGGWGFAMNTATGTTIVNALGAAGSTSLCRNASNEISTCSSSARYKNNINTFTPGLDLVKKLRPVSFNWLDGGMLDMGLVAEEVNKAEPLLTTTNAKGEVEGVKYDRVGVVLVNAVKEQQSQIEAQQKMILDLEKQNRLLQQQVELLIKLVCSGKAAPKSCENSSVLN